VIPSQPGISVEERHIGPRRERAGDDLVPTRDFSNDLNIAFQCEERRQRAANHRLIFGQQHADHDEVLSIYTTFPCYS